MVVRSRVNPLPVSEPGLTRDIRLWISASRERGLLDEKGKGERRRGRTGKKQKLSANASVILEDPGRSRASGWWSLRSHVRVRRQHCGLMRQRRRRRRWRWRRVGRKSEKRGEGWNSMRGNASRERGWSRWADGTSRGNVSRGTFKDKRTLGNSISTQYSSRSARCRIGKIVEDRRGRRRYVIDEWRVIREITNPVVRAVSGLAVNATDFHVASIHIDVQLWRCSINQAQNRTSYCQYSGTVRWIKEGSMRKHNRENYACKMRKIEERTKSV